MSFFPMFIELKQKKCLVVGGGPIAARKIQALLEFGGDVTAIATTFSDAVEQMVGIRKICRGFEENDLDEVDLVVAATDDPQLNHEIARRCKASRIPVNAVDQPEDCSFLFPAYRKQGEVVAAYSSGGQSPAIAQYLKAASAEILTKELGDLAARLGELRTRVKTEIANANDRKRFYQEVLTLSLEADGVLEEAEIEKILEIYKNKNGEN